MSAGTSFLELLVLFVGLLGLQPAGAPNSDKLELAYVAADECLLFASWNGWKIPDPKSENRTEQLFAEESVQDFAKQLADEVEKLFLNSIHKPEEKEVAAKAVPLLVRTLLSKPAAICIEGLTIQGSPPMPHLSIVVDCGDQVKQVREAIQSLLKLDEQSGAKLTEETIAGVKFNRTSGDAPDIWRMGFKDSLFVMTIGEVDVAKLLKRLDSKQPTKWIVDATQAIAVERPSLFVHLNVQAALKAAFASAAIADQSVTKFFEATGLSKVKYIASMAGLDKTGMRFNTEIATDGPPTGLLNLLPEAPLTIEAFQRVPANASHATIVKFDLSQAVSKVLVFLDAMNPRVRPDFEQGLEQIEPQIGFSIRKDVIEAFGDEWTMYSASTDGAIPFMPGLVITASVRKPANLSKALDAIVAAAQAALAQAGPQTPFTIQAFTARGEKGHRIQLNGLPIPVAPTWVLTKDQLVIGLTPQLVTSHLAAAGKPSLAENDAVKAAFQRSPKPSVVSFTDPKPVLQMGYMLTNTFSPMLLGQMAQQGIPFNLPPLPPFADIEQHLAPSVTTMTRSSSGWRMETRGVIPSGFETVPLVLGLGAAVAAPLVGQARVSSRRMQSMNNLKMIGLAMHNYHDVHKVFPAAASLDKKGKAQLSWRVHLLPYLDQAPLYQQFHLDEPWDSEHNKKLMDIVPPVFISPGSEELAKKGKTRFVVIRGEKTIFEGDGKTEGNTPLGIGLANITDGTSNTIMAVEAHPDAAVSWTKPDDLVIDFKKPTKGLSGNKNGGFHALFGDGRVIFLKDTLDAETLKKLFTRNGGEPISTF